MYPTFGTHDGTDLESVQWRRGGYDLAALSSIYTGDDARTRIALKELNDKVADVAAMRALGFCVSVEHARYMAQRFVDAGSSALAVSAETSAADRRSALTALRNREINILFAVDLCNEGLDIPEVDTVLFLRPTESATVFLQQLGRGLRMKGKTVLTALDFVGHQRSEFRFDQRFRALTGVGGRSLQRQVEEGFPFLPSGSQIVLDQSQSTTSSSSRTGQRYIHHRERRSQILLFVREAKTNALGTAPYVFLGPADYVSHERDTPMAITWRLHHPMPTEVYLASRAAVA